MTIITRSGDETQVNTTTALAQVVPMTVALANGQYVIAWGDNVDLTQAGPAQNANANIRAQIFNADGTRAGGEFVVTDAPGGQLLRSVTQLADGNLLFAWQEGEGTATGGQTGALFVREFSASGAAVTPALAAGAPGVEAINPDVVARNDGGYVMTWVSGGATPSVVAQIYDANNTAVGSQIIVDAYSVLSTGRPQIAAYNNGDFTIGWANSGPSHDSSSSVAFQRYTANGDSVGRSNYVFSSTNSPSFQLLARWDGTLAVIALPDPTASPWDGTHLEVSLFNQNGDFMPPIRLDYNETSAIPTTFRLANTQDGGFAVTWVETTEALPDGDGSGSSVRAAFFSAVNEPVVPNIPNVYNEETGTFSFTVNTSAAGNQSSPSMVTLANGDVVISWVDAGLGDGDQTGIRSQIIDVDPANRAPVASDVTFVGTLDAGDHRSTVIDVTNLLYEGAFDLDGDIVTLVGVSNAQNGVVDIEMRPAYPAPIAFVVFTPNPGYTGPAIFDYTVSDGRGGTATATATILPSPEDFVSIRGAAQITVDLAANDYLPVGADPYLYSLEPYYSPASLSGISMVRNVAQVIISPTSLQLYNPSNGSIDSYLNLPVGEVRLAQYRYLIQDEVTGDIISESLLTLELHGWMTAGTSGADTLTGTDLPDHLNGRGGADTLIGLGGDDYYTVSGAGTTVVEAVNGGYDIVATTLTNYTMGANVEELRFIGVGTNAVVAVGNDSNNLITGGAGNDTLYGGAGNDRLYGLVGDDLMVGGTGDDIYYVTTLGDQVTENAGEGTDLVFTSISYVLGANVENATLQSSASLNLTGNELDNDLRGNSAINILIGGAGNDRLSGFAGNDFLDGGTGVDTLAGGIGDDVYIVTSGDIIQETVNAGYDIAYAGESYTLSAGADVELLGTINNLATTAINLTGNELNNSITGNAGNNVLDGAGGRDYLIGRAGNDSYIVDAQDIVIENAGEGYDIIYARESYVLSAGVDVEVLGTVDNFATTAINLTGNGLNNYLSGNAGNNFLDGAGGRDYLVGRSGNDSYIVDAQDVVIEHAGEGYDIVYARETFVLGAGVEVEVLGTVNDLATTAINLTGNELNNAIVGNAGNNILDGGLGRDYLFGRDGDDVYFVDAQDVVVETVGGGFDTVYARESFVLSVDAQVELLAAIDNRATTAINLTGNGFNNYLSGNAGANILSGGAGHDYLLGREGNDTLTGGSGGDLFIFTSGSGTDTITDFTRGEDQISLLGFGLTFAGLQSQMTQNGADTMIQLTTGESIILANIQMSQLSASDFAL